VISLGHWKNPGKQATPKPMQHAAQIESAIDLLGTMSKSPIPMDNTIRDYMAARRFIGSRDRTAIVERVYTIIRAQARLGWWITQADIPDTPRARVLADLMLRERLDLESIESLFDGGKYRPSPLTESEKKFAHILKAQGITHPTMPIDVQCECPAWAYDRLHTLFGNDFQGQMAAMIDPAPLDLRVNTIKASVEEVMDSLQKDGIKVTRTPYSPVGLRALGKPFMGDTKAFKNGLVDIQDEGSQLIALISGAAPGMRVLDFCAGGGGKTLALAAMMANKGNIVAMDLDARRLEKGRPRYRKAGIHNVELRPLSEEQHRKWLRRQKGMMDIVLVDAPCSSSGTWRRNPDLRWNQYGPSLEEIKGQQTAILDKVADKVKVGGRLIYATCSLFAEENEDQVTSFLSRHEGFELIPLATLWPKGTPQPCAGPYLRLFPKDHGTDGFFAAALLKTTPSNNNA